MWKHAGQHLTEKEKSIGDPIIEGHNYYYMNKTRTMGMTFSGNFTRERWRWAFFDSVDAAHILGEGRKPYRATRKGCFVDTNRF